MSAMAFCLWCGVMVGIHCYLHPYNPPYLLFNVDKNLVSWPVYLVACTWFSWYAFGVTGVLAGLPFSGVIYFGFMIPIVKNDLKLGLKYYKTDDKLRESDHLINNWRSIEIFVKYVNFEFGVCFIYLQILFVNIILFCNVTLIFQWDDLRWNTKVLLTSICLFACFGWSIFLMLAGLQYSCSQETISSWKLEYWGVRDRSYMARVKRSCRPFSLGDGKKYSIRPVTVLKYLRSASQNTFRALITYGKVFEST